MADITIATLSHHLLQPWHPDYLQALVACAIFLALLTRRGVDNAGIVRSTLILLILMGVIGLGSGFISFFGMP